MTYKEIPNFKDYFINLNGDIISRKKGFDKILNGSRNNKGYKNYRLTNENGTFTMTLGRLLLMTFDRLPKDGEVCDHIDRNNKNDSISNLRWITNSANNVNRNSKKKYIGVYHKRHKLKNGSEATYFQAKTTVNGKSISIGYYKTDTEAHLAYIDYIEKLHNIKYKSN